MQKRIEAMEKAEREADFLLAEDAFVTDLKVFHHDPQLDEKYKKKIYNIPLGKWAIMPKSVHRGDSRPEVLSFNSLRDEKDEVVGHSFVAMQKDGSKFQIITNLQALEWLRTDLKNEKQELDNISLDKQFINEKTKQNISSSMQEDEVGAPLPTQTSLLRIMYENHSLEEDIEQVRLAFQTKNIIDQQVITKLVRKIVKQKKANEAFLNELKELVDLSYKTLDTSESIEQISHTNQILFYVKDNE